MSSRQSAIVRKEKSKVNIEIRERCGGEKKKEKKKKKRHVWMMEEIKK